MRDRELEGFSTFETRLSLDSIERLMCLAPHPDDEILGCGGLLAACQSSGKKVIVIILTRGDLQPGPTPESRREESIAAANVLGLAAPLQWDLPDRGVRYSQVLVDRLLSEIQAFQPTHILLPALSEPHPDHQATALSGMAAAMAFDKNPLLLHYEVGAPTQPNRLFDISNWADLKWRAVDCFKSQLEIQDYSGHSKAMAKLRALGLGESTAAEAFFEVSAEALRRHGVAHSLPSWGLTRSNRGLASLPSQIPAVSVIVRTTERTTLAEALFSIGAQTYSNIQVILVSVLGPLRGELPDLPPHVQLVKIEAPAGASRPWDRAQAANEGLKSVATPLAIFLDDDDLLMPEHVERLVSMLQQNPSAVAAYSGVRLENGLGELIRIYDQPWSRQRINGINFLPIHAVLFRVEVCRSAGLQFREDLPVLEDWVFWRELAARGDFAHVPGVSAVYRKLDQGSGLGDENGPHHWRVWHAKLLSQWAQAVDTEVTADLLSWHAEALDLAEWKLVDATSRAEVLRRQYEELNSNQERQRLELLRHCDRQIQALEESKSQLARGYDEQLRDLLEHRSALAMGYEQQLAAEARHRGDLISGYERQLQDLETSRRQLAEGYEQQLAEQTRQIAALEEGYKAQLAAVIDQRDHLERGYLQQIQVLEQVRRDQAIGYEQQLLAESRSRSELIMGYEQQLRDLFASRALLEAAYEQQLRELDADRRANRESLELRLADQARLHSAALHAANETIERASAEIKAIRASVLWKLTAPLRWFSR